MRGRLRRSDRPSPSPRLALEDAGNVGAPRQDAEETAARIAEPRRAEGVGDRRRGVADQKRGLQDERHALDDPPGLRLVGGAGEPIRQVAHRGVEGAVGPGRRGELGGERVEGGGLAAERAQHVERDDVARALPDAVDRALAEEPRQRVSSM